MSSFQQAQSYAERRRADGAALECIHALENNLPVPEILKLYADAGLLHTLPLVVDSHPLPDLERMVLTMGVGAAKQIEQSLNSHRDHTIALSDDKGFQRYMALRLQLVEGQQLAQELHEADLILRKCFMNYISSSIQLHRLMNEMDDHATTVIHSLGRLEFGTQAIIAGRMKEASKIALIKASKELEDIARTVSAYSGQDIVLGCIPTTALLKDEFLDDDEEDHLALVTGMDGKTIVSTAPLPPPPCLTTATFHVSHSSNSRSARIVVATVRKIASGAIKRVEECNEINLNFMNGVDTLSEGKIIRAPTVLPKKSSPNGNSSNGKNGTGTTRDLAKKNGKSSTVSKKFVPYDRAEMLEKEAGILISPAAKLHFSHIERDHKDEDLLDVKRKEINEYLQKRRHQRELVSQIGHENNNVSSAASAADTTSGTNDDNNQSVSPVPPSDANNTNPTVPLTDLTNPSSTLSSLMNVVQQMSTALASGGPVDTTTNTINAQQQLSSLAESLSSLSSTIVAHVGNVSTKNVMKALAAASSLPLDLASPPPKFNSQRTNNSRLLTAKADTPTRKPAIPPQIPGNTSNRGRASLSQKATNTMKTMLSNIVPTTTTVVGGHSFSSSSSRSKSQVANENQQVRTKSGSLVPVKDESYLRKFGSLMGSLHPHPHLGGVPTTTSTPNDTPTTTVTPSAFAHEPFGQRILDEAITLAQNGTPISRSPSPNSRNKLLKRQPSQADMYARETKLHQRADTNFVETAGYVMNLSDLAMKAGKVIYIPPNERPPTSSEFGKGEEIWRSVWADGVALTDSSVGTQTTHNPPTTTENGGTSEVSMTNHSDSSSSSVTGSQRRSTSLLRSSSSSSANSHLSEAEKARISVASVSGKHSQRIDRREDRIAAVAAAMEEKKQKRKASVERSTVRAHSPAVRGAELIKTAIEQGPLEENTGSTVRSSSMKKSYTQPPATDLGDTVLAGLRAYNPLVSIGSPLRTIPSVPNSSNPTPSPPSSSIPRSSPGTQTKPVNTMLLSPRSSTVVNGSVSKKKSNGVSANKMLGSPRMSVSMEVQGIYGTRFGPSAALVKHQPGLGPKHTHHYVAPSVHQEVANDQHQYNPTLLPIADVVKQNTGSEYRSSPSPTNDNDNTFLTNSNIGVTYVAVPVMEVNLGKEMFKVFREEEKMAAKEAAEMKALQAAMNASNLKDNALEMEDLGGNTGTVNDENTPTEDQTNTDPIVDGVPQSTIGFHVGMVSPRKLILNKMLQRKQVQIPPKLVTIETTDVISPLVPATSAAHSSSASPVVTANTIVTPFTRSSSPSKDGTTSTKNATDAVAKLLSPPSRSERPNSKGTQGKSKGTVGSRSTVTNTPSKTPSSTVTKKGNSVGGQLASDTATEIIGGNSKNSNGSNMMMTMDISEHLRQLAETPLEDEK